jgi:K(+)-stimulated pyrophosphate-energized sodium pump
MVMTPGSLTISNDAKLKITDLQDAWKLALPPIVAASLCFFFITFLYRKLKRQKIGKDIDIPKLDKLAAQVKSGAIAFLREEYKYLFLFVVALATILTVLYAAKPVRDGEWNDGLRMGGSFVMGAFLSALAGWCGMMVATDGNVRTTVACTKGSLNDGLQVAFTTGSIMGFTVVGLGMFGLGVMFWLVQVDRAPAESMQILAGFGFGASSIALFARVAGGIYTKAADVGADLVGKIEAGIDEDDPHNPAVIADNVGDNVGDVAGMGADLFESYVGSVIACATIGAENRVLLILPFWLSALGIVCSFCGFFAVSTKQEGKGWDVKLSSLMWALEKGMYVSGFLFLVLSAVLIFLLFGDSADGWKIYGCILMGLFAGALIGKVTEYFTSFDFGPVISIKDRGTTGPATVVIQGLGVGMISTLPPIVILCATILGCNELAGSYGISIAAVGMLSTLGITLATDAYGPVADNAGGLAEMAGLGPDVRAKTDSLDALGNTTAATGKGFAIGSAVLTSLSLLAAYRQQIGLLNNANRYDVSDAMVLTGLLFGAMLPYLFAALTMISVGKAAAEIIEEVRRQFREVTNPKTGRTLREAIERASRGETIPEDEDVEPDSDRCVQISTRSSVREMIAPGAYAILTPLIVGFTLGPRCLMGVLAGAIVSGAMLAIMMSNAGGAWDNSKKLCEKLKIKKTEQGKACIVGDTVGDPFKDTSGPALNILIKLMSMVALTIAPLLKDKENGVNVGNDDWERWYYGMIPLGVGVAITAILVYRQILTWKDPLASAQPPNPPAAPEPAVPEPSAFAATLVPAMVPPYGVEACNACGATRKIVVALGCEEV